MVSLVSVASKSVGMADYRRHDLHTLIFSPILGTPKRGHTDRAYSVCPAFCLHYLYTNLV